MFCITCLGLYICFKQNPNPIIIIVYSLVPALLYNQRISPYGNAGDIHDAGLDYIIANIGTDLVNELATDYIMANYSANLTFGNPSINVLTTLGYNVAVDANNTLSGIDLNGGYNMYVQKVFSFIDTFPPLMAESTKDKSYVIFGDNNAGDNNLYQSQFYLKIRELINDIFDSGLSADQQVLPLVGIAILSHSYDYWQKVYFNVGGANPWYTYITGLIGDVKDMDWRLLIQQDIKGALAGAVAGGLNYPENQNGGITIGAAAAGMAASAQTVVLQTGFIAIYDPA